MQKKELGLCLIGCGRAGMIHARNFAGKVKNAGMTAYADVNIEAAKNAAEETGAKYYYSDYRDALANPEVDAVIVVSPTDLHRRIVLDAAVAGKHIFCEKPMGMNAGECEEMIQACSKAGVKLQIGFMRRHDASFQEAKRLLDSGEIGELVQVHSHTRGPSKPQPWMYDLAKSNGILAEINSHDIDSIRYFSGSDVLSLYALGGNYRNPDAREKYPDYYDSVLVTGVLKSGAHFSINGAAYVEYGYDSHVELVGTKGVIHVGRRDAYFVATSKPGCGTSSPFVTSWRTLFEDAYLREDMAFVDSVLNDKPVLVTGYDGLMAVKIVEAGNRSIATGEVVTL
ncbi:MAG: Gfo/Idh/MocA family oxidoreductase [Clostridia bacterium]|nr:Gfo/Idh/MocA family oxidoreductase [Clostridia bacterium]